MGEMIAGLQSGDLFLAYQPKLNLRTGAIESVEALARWRHPRRGMIAPDMFVPMAEETGHIRALTDWALERAIADQKTFAAAGNHLEVSVNISGRLIGEPSFTEMVCKILDSAAAPLCFEITETALMEDPQRALQQLELFAARGVVISIDDYGAGLSSLGYLKVLPAKELKIDRMFLSAPLNNTRETFLLRSTIDLGHGLGMKVTAEGVEDAATLAVLAGLGCDFAQGYAISRALEPDRLIAFLKARRELAAAPALKREAS
jgi:EAL domain-containing protein (putative c-di-GMP-specific phosphodiesterase class I)